MAWIRVFKLAIASAIYFLATIALMNAEELQVAANFKDLTRVIQIAEPGDILKLSPGFYYGSITLDKPITIDGQNGAKLIGNKNSSIITISASDVIIKGLEISGSGSSHENFDSGIRLLKSATNAIIENNKILGNLIGINVHGAKNSLLKNNIIEGRLDRRMNDRGNSIYLWNARNTKIFGNDIKYGRDGIFVTTSNGNNFKGNRFRDLRFAIHYMYAHDSIIADNISQNNHLGYAIMNSNNVIVQGNVSQNDKKYGIMLNYTNKSQIIGNIITNNSGKCLFIYNAHKNIVKDNRFEKCDIGIHFSAGSEKNKIYQNAFISNRTQVKYAGSKWVNWSEEGKGNFWSDHASFDLNNDGIADSIYRPNDIMDKILWTHPAAKSLLGSPAVQLIKWSQSAFPALLPGGVIDKNPLMQPIKIKTRTWNNPRLE